MSATPFLLVLTRNGSLTPVSFLDHSRFVPQQRCAETTILEPSTRSSRLVSPEYLNRSMPKSRLIASLPAVGWQSGNSTGSLCRFNRPKYYVPRTPYATPTYYPQEPSSQFGSASLFAKLDVDTLFYIFYYCPGTYLQYLAAGELKKQSWRFHKQYLTWFQRANEPTTITETFEQGVYLYFDWEGECLWNPPPLEPRGVCGTRVCA